MLICDYVVRFYIMYKMVDNYVRSKESIINLSFIVLPFLAHFKKEKAIFETTLHRNSLLILCFRY
jgi:hypothetical protein